MKKQQAVYSVPGVDEEVRYCTLDSDLLLIRYPGTRGSSPQATKQEAKGA